MNPAEARACIDRLVCQDRERHARDPKLLKQFKATLKIVSEEIYSQNSHFVFELIQNAEDNAYPEGLADRYVRFVLDSRRICVVNNEVGFSAANVEAICSVGDSTKVDRTRGYVGEKGIGFKSVFKVSAAPEVHSGPFHFRFDDESYIVPAWCDPPRDLGIDPAATTIVLPLRPALRAEAGGSLWSDFRDLPGETLLFLKKVNRIVIEDRAAGTTRQLERRATGAGVIAVLDGPAETHWRIHGRDVAVPASLSEKKRQGVRLREVILGFRTDAEGHCLRPDDAVIYAFLPTGLSPGLPFLVQGDFLTTASRESIDSDSAWNVWLRDALAPTYLEAIRRGVVESEAFRLTFLRSLPVPYEVRDPFFRPLADGALAAIGRECVFPGESGRLRPLAEVFRADEVMRRLFPSECLATLMGTDVEYFDRRFQIPEEVSGWLEIADIGSSIAALLADEGWLAARDDDWFIDLYGYLNEHPDLIDDDDLRRLPIIRLEGGRLASVGEDLVYLPPSEERVEESYGLKQFTFLIVAHAIVRRHPSARKDDEKLLNRRTKAARDFLVERLGVKYHRPLEIAWNLVLPHLEGHSYDSVEALRPDFGLVLYIKEHWAQIQKDADEGGMNPADIFGGLPLPVVGTRKKQTVRGVGESYLPPDLGGEPGFARLFQGVPDVWFVDAELLASWDVTRKKKERKLKEWQAFLADLGAHRGMRLVHRESCPAYQEDVPPQDALGPGATMNAIAHQAEIADLPKLFAYLADKAQSTRDEKGRLLLKLLDRHWAEWETRHPATVPPVRLNWWESIYSYHPAGKRRGREEAKLLPCGFVRRLRAEAWVPTRGDGGPRRPGEVWVRDDDGLGLAAGRCLAVPVENANLVRALGLRTRLTVEELLAELDDRVEREVLDLGGYRQLFAMLFEAWREEGFGGRLAGHLAANRLIFLPGRPDFPFAAVDEVVWKHGPCRSSGGIPALESAYPALKGYFTRLGVPESATPGFALQTLRLVQKFYPDDDGERMALERFRAWEAYQTLARADFARDGGADELRKFQGDGRLLGEDGRFHPCDALIAPDDPELAALFRQAKGVRFLHLPDGHPDAPEVARAVASHLGLTRVSEAPRSVTFDERPPNATDAEVAAEFDRIRRELLGFIRKEARPRYEALVESGQATALAAAPLRFADRIEVGYTLLGRKIVAPRPPALAIDLAGLILHASRSEETLDLAAELQATLDVRGIANAFVTLMTLDPAKRRSYVDRMGYLVPDEEWATFGSSARGDDPAELGVEKADLTRTDPRAEHDPACRVQLATYESSTRAELQGRAAWPGSLNGPPGVPPADGMDRVGATEKCETAAWDAAESDRKRRLPVAWAPPVPGREYKGPTKLRSPRGSNDRLIERLGERPARREVREYLKGPQEVAPPVADPDEPLPATIRTTLFAVNLQHGFLRFAPPDFRMFGPSSPASIELIDDDDERIAVDVDYRAGILHGSGLADWLATHAEWPYGAILRLDPTIAQDRYHLHASPLEGPVDIGDVEFFDFDDGGVPEVLTVHADPFRVEFDENVYRQERRWENRGAYEALIKLGGDAVLTAVHEELAAAGRPLSASEIHRALLLAGHPCSFFSVRAILYGYACFAREGDRWALVKDRTSALRPGYDAASIAPPGGTSLGGDPPLSSMEATRLIARLKALSRPDPEEWQECLADLLSSLTAMQSRLERKALCGTR